MLKPLISLPLLPPIYLKQFSPCCCVKKILVCLLILLHYGQIRFGFFLGIFFIKVIFLLVS